MDFFHNSLKNTNNYKTFDSDKKNKKNKSLLILSKKYNTSILLQLSLYLSNHKIS